MEPKHDQEFHLLYNEVEDLDTFCDRISEDVESFRENMRALALATERPSTHWIDLFMNWSEWNGLYDGEYR